MSKKIKSKNKQQFTLSKNPIDMFHNNFNLDKQDAFVTQRGVRFNHYRAIPSPIGLNDRGDYRRPEMQDTESSAGFLYELAGTFTAVLASASTKKQEMDGGLFDQSTARIVLPRYYDKCEEADSCEEIHLVRGDRIYAADIELKVPNYQRVEHNPNSNSDILHFPVSKVEVLIDSLNNKYRPNIDFKVNCDGNVEWLKNRPGIDDSTGRGRIYSVRYLYLAHWYVDSVPNEIRITTVEENGVKVPKRMPYSAMLQREYIYRNQNRDEIEDGKNDRKNESNDISDDANKQFDIKVDLNDFE